MVKRIFIVERDPIAMASARASFDRPRYEILEAATPLETMELMANGLVFDAAIIDVGYPEDTGIELLIRLRRETDRPILLVTRRHDTSDAVLALRSGADDYVTKSVEPAELRARVEAVLRRSDDRLEQRPAQTVGRLVLDRDAREVLVGGALVALTAREFELLSFFADNPRRVFSRAHLMQKVWGSDAWGSDATVTEHVRRLRRKLGQRGMEDGWLTTVRGGGYRFDA